MTLISFIMVAAAFALIVMAIARIAGDIPEDRF